MGSPHTAAQVVYCTILLDAVNNIYHRALVAMVFQQMAVNCLVIIFKNPTI